jgi:hypothetical protein
MGRRGWQSATLCAPLIVVRKPTMRLILVLSIFATSAGDQNAAVAMLQRMSDSSVSESQCLPAQWREGRCWLGTDWQAVNAMGFAAIDDFNARDGSSVPQFATLGSCDKRLVPQVSDTQSSGAVAFDTAIAFNFPQNDTCHPDRAETPVAIVGPCLSTTSKVIARAPGASLLNIAHWASNVDLSDTSTFPHYGRSYPTDEAWAIAACTFWDDLEYRSAAVVFSQEPYGTSVSAILRRECAERGIAVTALGFATGSADDARRCLGELADTGLQVVLWAITGGADLGHVISAAIRQADILEQLRSSGLLWIFSDWVTLSDVAALPAAERAALHGSLFVAPIGANPTDARWTDFTSRKWPALDESRINAQLPAAWPLASGFFASTSYESEVAMANIGAFQYDGGHRRLEHTGGPKASASSRRPSRLPPLTSQRVRCLLAQPSRPSGCCSAVSRRRALCQPT